MLHKAVLEAYPLERPPQTTMTPPIMIGCPLIPPSLKGPLAGGMGVEEVEVARVVVTLMKLTSLEEGIRKRMDFQVRSKSPNLGARRVILMMWLMPLGRGLTVSPTIMIIMRILISCPW